MQPFLRMRFLNFFFIPVAQEYLNEILPTLHGPNKLKTLRKPLRIADLQTPASGQDKSDTLYVSFILFSSRRRILLIMMFARILVIASMLSSSLLYATMTQHQIVSGTISRYLDIYTKATIINNIICILITAVVVTCS